MSYYDTDYFNTPVASTTSLSSSAVWVIISIVVAIIGAIALYITFFNKKNENKYTGFLKVIYDFFNFKYFVIYDLFKLVYLMCAIALTLLSFTYISTSFWKFLSMLILGNFGLRVTYEFIMLTLELCNNVKEINKKMK